MKRIVLRFGLASGFLLMALTSVSLSLCMKGILDFSKMELVGYSSMVLAFLFVFFGIRSYRDNVAGGAISFGKAVQVGLLISLVTCAMYVIAWEIAYYNFFPDFFDQYTAHVLERMREAGESAAAIGEKRTQMEKIGELYTNPLFNIGITFLEIFPMGLVVTLVSAGILRRKVGPVAPATEVTA